MSTESALPSANVQRVLPAPPAAVYDAWLDESALAEFICPEPGVAAEVSVDPRIGGQLRVLMSFPDSHSEVTGEYIALDRPDRLSFTWRAHDGQVDSVVTVVFEPHGEGETLMTITHSKLPPDLVAQHSEGWSSIADQLEARFAQRRRAASS